MEFFDAIISRVRPFKNFNLYMVFFFAFADLKEG